MTFHTPGTFDDLEQWSSGKFTVEMNLPIPEIEVRGKMLPDFYQVMLRTHDHASSRLLARSLMMAATDIYRHLEFWGDPPHEEAEERSPDE